MVAFYPFGLPNVNAAGPPAHILPEVVEGVPNNLVKPLLQGVLPGYNVNVSNLEGNESEVSIDVNPTDPDNQVIVGHAPDFTTMNTFFTRDGGQNWTLGALGDSDDGLVSTFRFDPTVAFDDNGNVYVAYGVRTVGVGGNQRTVVVCRSYDGGETYIKPCTHVATNPDIDGLPGNDKWMLAAGPGPAPPTRQNVYIAWTQNVTESTGIDQRIVLSVSTDGGANFSSAVIVNDGSIDTNPEDTKSEVGNLFADPAVGPNGEVYVAWHNTITGDVFVDVSFDGGTTFWTDKPVTTSGTGFKTAIPAAPDRGVHVGPTIDVDRSGGDYNGRLYITYTDIGTGGLPDTDIFVRFSDDLGATWLPQTPILVNDDGGTNSQFLPWLDVDQLTGLVSTVWYDARNDPDNKKVEVFMGISADGGATFQNIRVSDGQSDQSVDNRKRTLNNYLEYIGIATFGCMAFPVWADNSTRRKDLDFFTDQVILVRDPCPGEGIPIDVDIKPRNDPNSINLKSKATIPVAILTTSTFDASTVIPVSVEFGPEGATEAHGQGHIKDVDGDGDLDLLLHFNVQETGIACGDTSASLTGMTFDGQTIEGSDSIRTVGCGGGP